MLERGPRSHEERIADGRVLALIRSYLDQGVMEGLRHYEAEENGTPQGAGISPSLANIYLNPLDRLMAESGCEMVRYADDFVILCRSREAAEAALARVQTRVEENALTLHPEKTRRVDATQRGGLRLPRLSLRMRLPLAAEEVRGQAENALRELTPRRSCGNSLEHCITQLNGKR